MQIDSINSNYFSQEFSVTSNYSINNFNVSLEGENTPDGSFIADTNNNNKTNFSSSDKFKVLIPIDNITEDSGKFNVNITANIKTQKVLFGDAPDTLQDHAITIMASEDITRKCRSKIWKSIWKN